jgi:hypothetical protein
MGVRLRIAVNANNKNKITAYKCGITKPYYEGMSVILKRNC